MSGSIGTSARVIIIFLSLASVYCFLTIKLTGVECSQSQKRISSVPNDQNFLYSRLIQCLSNQNSALLNLQNDLKLLSKQEKISNPKQNDSNKTKEYKTINHPQVIVLPPVIQGEREDEPDDDVEYSDENDYQDTNVVRTYRDHLEKKSKRRRRRQVTSNLDLGQIVDAFVGLSNANGRPASIDSSNNSFQSIITNTVAPAAQRLSAIIIKQAIDELPTRLANFGQLMGNLVNTLTINNPVLINSPLLSQRNQFNGSNTIQQPQSLPLISTESPRIEGANKSPRKSLILETLSNITNAISSQITRNIIESFKDSHHIDTKSPKIKLPKNEQNDSKENDQSEHIFIKKLNDLTLVSLDNQASSDRPTNDTKSKSRLKRGVGSFLMFGPFSKFYIAMTLHKMVKQQSSIMSQAVMGELIRRYVVPKVGSALIQPSTVSSFTNQWKKAIESAGAKSEASDSKQSDKKDQPNLNNNINLDASCPILNNQADLVQLLQLIAAPMANANANLFTAAIDNPAITLNQDAVALNLPMSKTKLTVKNPMASEHVQSLIRIASKPIIEPHIQDGEMIKGLSREHLSASQFSDKSRDAIQFYPDARLRYASSLRHLHVDPLGHQLTKQMPGKFHLEENPYDFLPNDEMGLYRPGERYIDSFKKAMSSELEDTTPISHTSSTRPRKENESVDAIANLILNKTLNELVRNHPNPSSDLISIRNSKLIHETSNLVGKSLANIIKGQLDSNSESVPDLRLLADKDRDESKKSEIEINLSADNMTDLIGQLNEINTKNNFQTNNFKTEPVISSGRTNVEPKFGPKSSLPPIGLKDDFMIKTLKSKSVDKFNFVDFVGTDLTPSPSLRTIKDIPSNIKKELSKYPSSMEYQSLGKAQVSKSQFNPSVPSSKNNSIDCQSSESLYQKPVDHRGSGKSTSELNNLAMALNVMNMVLLNQRLVNGSLPGDSQSPGFKTQGGAAGRFPVIAPILIDSKWVTRGRKKKKTMRLRTSNETNQAKSRLQEPIDHSVNSQGRLNMEINHRTVNTQVKENTTLLIMPSSAKTRESASEVMKSTNYMYQPLVSDGDDPPEMNSTSDALIESDASVEGKEHAGRWNDVLKHIELTL